MTDEKKRKPSGFCAWHPEKGWLKGYDLFSVTQSFDGALDELREALHDDFDKANCGADVRLNLGLEFVPWARAQGWQIREVYILETKELEEIVKYLETYAAIRYHEGYHEHSEEVVNLITRLEEGRTE